MEVCVAVGIPRPTTAHTCTHVLRTSPIMRLTGMVTNLDQVQTDVCQQEMNVAETWAPFNCNNTQVTL